MKIEELERTHEEIEIFMDYCRSLGFLNLQGKNGTGKTEVAKAIYQCFTPYQLPAYDHDKAIFITQAALNITFVEGFDKWGPMQTINYFKQPKMLVIDDLGSRTPSEAFRDFLLDIVDSRYNNRSFQATIITTNKTSQDLQNLFGSDIFSRITSGMNMLIEDDEDRRGEKWRLRNQATKIRPANDIRSRVMSMKSRYPSWSVLGDNIYISFEKNGYKYCSQPIKIGSDECLKLLEDAENITKRTLCQTSNS